MKKKMKNLLTLIMVVVLFGSLMGCHKEEAKETINYGGIVEDEEEILDEIVPDTTVPDTTVPDTTVPSVEEPVISEIIPGKVHESSTLSVGDMQFTYPISWTDLKVTLDKNNIDYTELNSDIENNNDKKAYATLYLDDDELSNIIVYLRKIDNQIIVEKIGIDFAYGFDYEKYQVSFDGKINSNSTIEDAIALYGEPDNIYENTKKNQYYAWVQSETRKFNLVIATGIQKDESKISLIDTYISY